jgi:hypothetical protein
LTISQKNCRVAKIGQTLTANTMTFSIEWINTAGDTLLKNRIGLALNNMAAANFAADADRHRLS